MKKISNLFNTFGGVIVCERDCVIVCGHGSVIVWKCDCVIVWGLCSIGGVWGCGGVIVCKRDCVGAVCLHRSLIIK